jgi:hypothetical protein
VTGVTQPSLFSAETMPPSLADLGGLLAAHGQAAAGAAGARLSILLADRWRADALAAECARREIDAEVLAAEPADPGAADGPVVLLRTDRTEALAALAAAWTRGAVKAVPAGLTAEPGLLRVWLIAAGRRTSAGFGLGLDPHARDTHQPLAAACARAGLAGALVGATSDTPVIRLTGRKRLGRLGEMIGDPPPGAPGQAWPARDT